MYQYISRFKFGILFSIFLLSIECSSQNEKTADDPPCIDRNPIVAGQFYPSNPEALMTVLGSHFGMAEKNVLEGDLRAILVPHAGYTYSGKVAASGYSMIDHTKSYKNIFIIASSHRIQFNGASVYNAGDYITPLGKVKVNRELASKIINENNVMVYREDAHTEEHSLEVQLPFLQYIFEDDLQIIPIVTGTQNVATCKKIAAVLKPYFTPDNLFIISSDFSHYPTYDDAVKADENTAKAILNNSPRLLMNAINENASKGYENLLTSICGWPAVMSFLYITEGNTELHTQHLDYQNSGDVSGDKSRVVGYHSIAFVSKEKQKNMSEEFKMTDQEKKVLLSIARETIAEYLETGKVIETDKYDLTETLKSHCGAFVSLHINGALRGCIGRFMAEEPLCNIVQKMAIASATEDHRFSVVKKSELNEIDIEISVLTPMKKIESIDEIVMGKHGIYIKKGVSSGTFLPQVAQQTGWTKEEFLGHCAKDKARIGWEGWKEAEIFTYEAYVFSEKEFE